MVLLVTIFILFFYFLIIFSVLRLRDLNYNNIQKNLCIELFIDKLILTHVSGYKQK